MLLPPEAAEVIARLPDDQVIEYGICKEALLRRHKLSPEGIRVKLRSVTIGQDQYF